MANSNNIGATQRIPNQVDMDQARERLRSMTAAAAPQRVDAVQGAAPGNRSSSDTGGNSSARERTPRQSAADLMIKQAESRQQQRVTRENIEHAKQFANNLGSAHAIESNATVKSAAKREAHSAIKGIEELVGRKELSHALQRAQDRRNEAADTPAAQPTDSPDIRTPQPSTEHESYAPPGRDRSDLSQAVNAQTARDATQRPTVPTPRPAQEPTASQPTDRDSAPTESPTSRPAVRPPSSRSNPLQQLHAALTERPEDPTVRERFSEVEARHRDTQASTQASHETSAQHHAQTDDQMAQLAADQALVEQANQRTIDAVADLAVHASDPAIVRQPASLQQAVDHTLREAQKAQGILDGVIRKQSTAPAPKDQPIAQGPTAEKAQKIVEAVLRQNSGTDMMTAQRAPQPTAVAQLLV